MIQKIRIQNFKSIVDLTLELGRVTVLIGENGAGKSNILEAIAFLAAASDFKLEDEFLTSRGIRMPARNKLFPNFEPETEEIQAVLLLMLESFGNHDRESKVGIIYDEEHQEWSPTSLDLLSTPMTRQRWETLYELYDKLHKYSPDYSHPDWGTVKQTVENKEFTKVADYLIYSPEYRALRIFDDETQIRPLGINGAGLFRLVKKISQENPEVLEEIREGLKLLDWFEDLEIPTNLFATERYLNIKDRYIDETMDYFDQRSTNEGFVFLLFYLTLFVSKETPAFFAIDNIDASLNPKLCRRLMSELVKLAKKHNKQVILTTHNPGLLDGLNLHDDEQRLLVVSRNLDGHTKVRRIEDKRNLDEQVRLSEAFLRGYLGGLPKNF